MAGYHLPQIFEQAIPGWIPGVEKRDGSEAANINIRRDTPNKTGKPYEVKKRRRNEEMKKKGERELSCACPNVGMRETGGGL